MKHLSLLVALVACACPTKNTEPLAGGSGSGSQLEGQGPAGACDAIRAKVEALYRAEAQAKEPKRVEAAVADNTAMVLTDCAKEPAKVVACVRGVATVKELETSCLAPIDDEGSEGDALK